MTEPTNESVREDRERQTQLLADLRAAGRTTEADQLSVNYHGLQMAGLAQDAYRAAAGTGAPPPGWTRASEHPEQLQALAPGLSREQINEMLRPEGSGFRAEIYLPDPAILGPDARPVFAVKGSTGPIVDPAAPGGMRESGAEDYLANNIPQGLGQRADYYDRAMDAARLLQSQPGLDFEITGHSLGGGIASAAGAVTGVQTTTFNAAGLHPNTAARYVEENGGAVHDLRATITAFQVNGDVLTDSQTAAQRMSEASRQEAGALANGIGQVLQTPGIRDRVQGQIDGMLPENARGPAMAAIDLLATQPGADLLRDVPTAAGNVQPLMPAMAREGDGHVPRPNEMPVSELMTYAGPLVDVLNTAAVGGRVGRTVGEGVQVAGQGVESVLHYGGTGLDYTARYSGEAVAAVSDGVGTIGSTAVRAGGEVVVGARVAAGYVGAGIDLAQGEVQQTATSWTASAMRWAARALPEDAERWVGRQAQGVEAYGDAALAHNRDAARQSMEAAQTDAGRIREGASGVAGTIDNNAAAIAATARQTGQQVGATLQEGADAAGRTVRGVTDQAPAVGAVVGTGIGLVGGAAITYGPLNPYAVSNMGQTFTFGQNAAPSGQEALQRHLMETVTPSLEAVVRTQEAQARELLQASRVQDGAAPPSLDAPSRPVTPPPATPLLDDAAHPNNGMYRDAQRGVNALGAPFDAMSQPQRDQLAGALVADSVDAGLTRIARVDPGAGNGRIFASDNQDPSAAHNRIAGTDVAQGQAQPLAASTQQVDRVHERAAEQAAQPPQQQTQNDPQQEVAPRKVA
ncbi:MAG: XVIPCD domain-containing protein [Pseudomonadota bacterium]